jgi:hypothetical protein
VSQGIHDRQMPYFARACASNDYTDLAARLKLDMYKLKRERAPQAEIGNLCISAKYTHKVLILVIWTAFSDLLHLFPSPHENTVSARVHPNLYLNTLHIIFCTSGRSQPAAPASDKSLIKNNTRPRWLHCSKESRRVSPVGCTPDPSLPVSFCAIPKHLSRQFRTDLLHHHLHCLTSLLNVHSLVVQQPQTFSGFSIQHEGPPDFPIARADNDPSGRVYLMVRFNVRDMAATRATLGSSPVNIFCMRHAARSTQTPVRHESGRSRTALSPLPKVRRPWFLLSKSMRGHLQAGKETLPSPAPHRTGEKEASNALSLLVTCLFQGGKPPSQFLAGRPFAR